MAGRSTLPLPLSVSCSFSTSLRPERRDVECDRHDRGMARLEAGGQVFGEGAVIERAPGEPVPEAAERTLVGATGVHADRCGGELPGPLIGCDKWNYHNQRELGIAAVPHGFRSSFRNWEAEETDHPREVVEAALAHKVRN